MNHRVLSKDLRMDVLTTHWIIHPTLLVRIFFSLEITFISIPLAIHGDTLYHGTICPSSQQYLSSHYNLHSMYGYFEAKATNE